MFVKSILVASLACSASLCSPLGHAETLAVYARPHHVSSEAGSVPGRGMSMAQVERRFGAPLEKLSAAGGDAPRHPVIHRWRYHNYTVYFERNRVIHSVLDSASVLTR